MLRHFLYLNEDLVRDFLGQMPGGLERETERHLEHTGRRSVEGGASIGPVGIKGDLGNETKRLSDVTVEHAAAGDFQRLYSALSAAEAIQDLRVLDEKIWSDLQPSEILEVGALITLPAIARLVDLTDKFAPMAQLLGGLGKVPGAESVDWNLVTGMMSLFRTEHPSFLPA